MTIQPRRTEHCASRNAEAPNHGDAGVAAPAGSRPGTKPRLVHLIEPTTKRMRAPSALGQHSESSRRDTPKPRQGGISRHRDCETREIGDRK